jgi:septum formation protein
VSRPDCRLVLGSRSPRRLELLRQIWPAELIDIVPPSSTAEAHFNDLHDWPSIERRLLEIAGTKWDDVAAQLRNTLGDCRRNSEGGSPSPSAPLPQGERGEEECAPREGNSDSLSPLSPCGRGAGGEGEHAEATAPIVIAADTVVIVDRGGLLHVLGQPPADDTWQETVRRWFREDFAGKTHTVATALCLERLHKNSGGPPSPRLTRVVTSRVTFVDDVDRWLEWYLATGEPCGKAGGYALQGAGSIFIAKVEGSLSNVVGLPLAELLEMIKVLVP